MTTLSQYYAQKNKNGTGTTTKKTFMVPFEELYTVEGTQGRPLNLEHAEKMRDLWIAGVDLPPLLVEVTPEGVKVIDGQHRHYGAHLAREKGTPIPRIECKDFIGTPLQKLAIQVGSSESLQMTAIERAVQYNRAKNQGYTIPEIAEAFRRSVTDINDHLLLLSSGEALIRMVDAGEVSATTAVEMSKKHGPSAGLIAEKQLEKAKASGKKKLTRAAAMPQFSATRARRLVELLQAAEFEGGGENRAGDILTLKPGTAAEINLILAEYEQHLTQTGEGA
ncbi:DNA-binding protein [Erwiniaceae bacterium L1_54_3]|nr:DNA-binding protein [Erwiniaceae bacterium L1_54_3]